MHLGAADAGGALSYERLVEGEYDIVLSHPDHYGRTNRVEILRDRPASVSGALDGKPGTAYVSASPEAEVRVDGARAGKTGEVLENLKPGTRKFEVRLRGYRTERFTLDIPPNAAAPRKVLGDLARESGALRVVVRSAAAGDDYLAKQPVEAKVGLAFKAGRSTCTEVDSARLEHVPVASSQSMGCKKLSE